MSIDKLFTWKVCHFIRNRDGSVVRRLEKGIVRAADRDEAEAILRKLVCTTYSKDLIITEIPDKMAVYSFGHIDSVINT